MGNFINNVNPLVVIIGIPLVLAIAWYVVIVPSWRRKNAKAAIGHVLAEFATMSGNSYTILCQEQRGEAVKKAKKKLRDTDNKAESLVTNPNKTEIGYYWVLPEFCFNTLYPENMPRDVQVTIKKAYYLENDPMPQLCFKPELWTEERKTRVSAQMNALARDEASMKAQNELDREIFKDVKSISNSLKSMPLLKILVIASVAASAISCFLVLQNGNGIAYLTSLFGG